MHNNSGKFLWIIFIFLFLMYILGSYDYTTIWFLHTGFSSLSQLIKRDCIQKLYPHLFTTKDDLSWVTNIFLQCTTKNFHFLDCQIIQVASNWYISCDQKHNLMILCCRLFIIIITFSKWLLQCSQTVLF